MGDRLRGSRVQIGLQLGLASKISMIRLPLASKVLDTWLNVKLNGACIVIR